MRTPHSQRNHGLIKFLVLIIGLVLTFALSGFDMRGLISDGGVTQHIERGRAEIEPLWNSYLGAYWERFAEPYVLYFWNTLAMDIVTNGLYTNIEHILANEPTTIETTIQSYLGNE